MAKQQKHKGLWVSENREWAKQCWDTYGFDYDPATGDLQVFVWPLEGVSMDQLKENLDSDQVQYEEGTSTLH